MELTLNSSSFPNPNFKHLKFTHSNNNTPFLTQLRLNFKPFRQINRYACRFTKISYNPRWDFTLKSQISPIRDEDSVSKRFNNGYNEMGMEGKSAKFSNLDVGFVRRGLVVVALIYSVIRCRNVLAMEGILGGGYAVGVEQMSTAIRNAWPTFLRVLWAFKEHGLVLTLLLGLSAFFSMAETSITTLWPWKVRELAEKDSENGVFKMLRNDVTRFLTTILIGTTVVNIGATALVTEAATNLFGEAGVGAATGVMTVAILLLTEITPKSIAVHHATEVARFVVRPVAWLSLVLYPIGKVVTFLSGRMLKMLGLKAASEPNVTEEELKLMLRVAEKTGAIEEEEQDMIENVLEIKDTCVREVMTPLVDVVAIDAHATLIDFHNTWGVHEYSRVPVFEQRIDNIVGIAYAMDLLDFIQKQKQLDGSVVGDIAQPAYFVPDSMSVWNLLREFRIRKVHMAVVLNEYGGTIGSRLRVYFRILSTQNMIVTMEDVVEEIVGEIFDENDSKEEIQKKTGYIVMRAEGIFDVDASTSIDQLCEDLGIVLPEDHHYETVSGFVCEAFGCIPRTSESIKVVLDKAKKEERDYNTEDSSHKHVEEKYQVYKLEILAANSRKVSSVRFERVKQEAVSTEVTRVVPVPKMMKKRLKVNEDSLKNNDRKALVDKTDESPLVDISWEITTEREIASPNPP